MAVRNASQSKAILCIQTHIFTITFGLAETTAWTLLSVITVFANAFSIAKIVKRRHRNVDHKVYVSSLLFSDLIIGAVVHTLLAYASCRLAIPCQLARVVAAVAFFNILVSTCSALALAVNRCRSFKVRSSQTLNRMNTASNSSPKKSLIVVSVIWLCALILVFMISLNKGNFYQVRMLFGVLWTLVIVVNFLVMLKIRKLKAFHASQHGLVPNRQHQVIPRLIHAVTITLLLTYFPVVIVSALQRCNVFVSDLTNAVSHKIVLLGPAVDPLCYVALSYFFK